MPDLKSELTRVGDAVRVVQPPKPGDLLARGKLRLPSDRPSWERRPKRPPPPSFFVRELTMCDGRRITIDKRGIGFVCEGNAGADGKAATIVAFRTNARPVPVREAYDDVVTWWRGPAADKGDRQ
jgi:hypothetical protein